MTTGTRIEVISGLRSRRMPGAESRGDVTLSRGGRCARCGDGLGAACQGERENREVWSRTVTSLRGYRKHRTGSVLGKVIQTLLSLENTVTERGGRRNPRQNGESKE